MKNKITQMLDLQEELNINTSGESWKKGITNKGKIINWKRCMYMEMFETIDSFPWKHWKNINGETNIKNLKIELVDIWHFLLSELLSNFENKNNIISLIEKNSTYQENFKIPVKWTKQDNLKLDTFLKPFEDFILICLKKENNFIDSIVRQFFICLNSIGITFEELYKLYIGKNVLNKFRQEHGYKEGKYKKIWQNGKEDNEIMQEFLNNKIDIAFNEIYSFLEKTYKNL